MLAAGCWIKKRLSQTSSIQVPVSSIRLFPAPLFTTKPNINFNIHVYIMHVQGRSFGLTRMGFGFYPSVHLRHLRAVFSGWAVSAVAFVVALNSRGHLSLFSPRIQGDHELLFGGPQSPPLIPRLASRISDTPKTTGSDSAGHSTDH